MSIPGSEARSNLILDARGDPMVRAARGDTAWAGASREPPSLRDWNPSYGSADADMVFDTAEIRARSRDLDRNESLARGYFDTTTVSAIGTGLMPVPRVDWRVLGRTREWADEWNQRVRPIARDYYDSTDVDASRQGGFGEQQALACRNVLMSGSVGALMTWRPDDCAKWASSVHLIEADRIAALLVAAGHLVAQVARLTPPDEHQGRRALVERPRLEVAPGVQGERRALVEAVLEEAAEAASDGRRGVVDGRHKGGGEPVPQVCLGGGVESGLVEFECDVEHGYYPAGSSSASRSSAGSTTNSAGS